MRRVWVLTSYSIEAAALRLHEGARPSAAGNVDALRLKVAWIIQKLTVYFSDHQFSYGNQDSSESIYLKVNN